MRRQIFIVPIILLLAPMPSIAATPYQSTFDAVSRPNKTYEQYVQFVVSPNGIPIEDLVSEHRKTAFSLNAVLLAFGNTGSNGGDAVMSFALPKEQIKTFTDSIKGSGRLIAQTIQTENMDIQSIEAQAIQRRDDALTTRDQIQRLATESTDRLLSIQSIAGAEKELAEAQAALRDIQQRRSYIFVNVLYHQDPTKAVSLKDEKWVWGLGGLVGGTSLSALLIATVALSKRKRSV